MLLEPYSERNAAAFEDLERRWELDAAMGGRPQPGPSFAAPMLITDNRNGKPIGLAVDRRLLSVASVQGYQFDSAVAARVNPAIGAG